MPFRYWAYDEVNLTFIVWIMWHNNSVYQYRFLAKCVKKMVTLFPPKPRKRMTTNTMKNINNSWELLSCSVICTIDALFPSVQRMRIVIFAKKADFKTLPFPFKVWKFEAFRETSMNKPGLIKSESVGSFTARYENKTRRDLFECVAFCKRSEAQGCKYL